MESPMLLSVYEEGILAKSPSWFISEKYDGWRMMYRNGAFYSRTGQELSVPAEMRKQMEQFGNDVVLDGELWLGYGKFTEIQAALNDGSDKLKFLVFDMPSSNGPFQERFKDMTKLFANHDTSLVQLVEQMEVDNADVTAINKYYDTVINKGGEGIVLKPSSLMYEYGKRSNMYLKRKPWDTMDVVVVGYFTTKTQSSDNGYVSSLVCETAEGKTFKVQFKSYNAPAIGTTVVIKYSQTTVTGLPKFPQLVNTSSAVTKKIVKARKNPKTPKIPKTPKVPEIKPLDITNLMSMAQWKAKGGYVLQNAEEVHVKSDRTDEVYVVKRAKQGDSVYCSCPAWKFQKLTPVCRTCKHCIAVLGAKTDAIRVAKVVIGVMD